MTYRLSMIPNLCWLHQAEPARPWCVYRSRVWLANNPCWLNLTESARSRWPDRFRVWLTSTIPPKRGDVPGPKGRDSLVSSAVKSAKRHAEIAVASSVNALSP